MTEAPNDPFHFDAADPEYRRALELMREVLGPADSFRIERLLDTEPGKETIGWFFKQTWGNLYAREDKVPLRDRALVLIGTDLALGRAGPLRDHIKVALHAGVTPVQLVELMFQAAFYVGIPALGMGLQVAKDVFQAAERKKMEAKRMAEQDNSIDLGSINHVAMVVRDWRVAAKGYAKLMGLRRWKMVEIGPQLMTECQYYGADEPCTWISAFAKSGDTLIELCQPVEGKSIFADFLRDHGEGMQHVGNLSHPRPRQLVESWTAQGVKIGNYCNIADVVKLYYLDTREHTGGMFLEVVDPASFAAIPAFGEDFDF
jgi:alkylhydroperoxidase/carboxymuconolactone decarboxylase family protein YurZ/catechol 2,3-dioxygenase-like lactoylglutathione lyase family enzyme